MIHETTTSLAPEEVLRRAKEFFAERVPATGCFLERESPRHVALRGQGGEEIVIAVFPMDPGAGGGTAVRGSTLLFDQQVGRFLATLPETASPEAAPDGRQTAHDTSGAPSAGYHRPPRATA